MGQKKVQILQQAGYILGPGANALDEVSGNAVWQHPDEGQTKVDSEECRNRESQALQAANITDNGPISHVIAPSSSGSSSDGDSESDMASSDPSDAAEGTGSMVIRNINIATAGDLASGAMRLGRTVRFDIVSHSFAATCMTLIISMMMACVYDSSVALMIIAMLYPYPPLRTL